MTRDEVFAVKFDNVGLKVVACGFEEPANDIVICYTDEFNRSFDFLLNRNDAIKLVQCMSIDEKKVVNKS